MGESQFEKMCKALAEAERERDLSRHTVEVQDGIINELREDNERLRGLLGKCVPYILRPYCSSIRLEMIEKIKKEIGNE